MSVQMNVIPKPLSINNLRRVDVPLKLINLSIDKA